MFKLLCVLNFLVLATSNPLQGLTSCPVIFYQRKPEVPLTQTSNFNPYQQQNIVQNQIVPSYQTVPYLYNDQIRGLYLDKVQSYPSISPFLEPNSPFYDQNGYKIIRYVTNPAAAQPNVVNNYIIVPKEYLTRNQSISNVIQTGNGNEYYKYFKVHNQEEKVKTKREETKPIDTNANNNEDKLVCQKTDNHMSTKNINNQDNSHVKKKRRKSSKSNEQTSKTLESPNAIEDYYPPYLETKPKDHRTQRSKKTSDVEKDERNEEHKSSRQDGGNSKTTETSNKKSKRKRKSKSKKNTIESQSSDDFLVDFISNDKAKDVTRNTADVEVDFDINEDCACPANRKTRNNCCQPRNNYQQCYPRDFSENIVAYLNSLMSNPQFGTNYFNPFANFPYNLNYMYQMPQQYTRSNESNKKCKNKRKKEKSKKNNGSNTKVKQNSNKNQDQDVTLNNCEKVVELEPEFIEIEKTNEPSISEDITNELEHADKLVKKEKTKEQETDQNVAEVPGITHPVVLYADADSKETFYVAPILENDIPFLNYNDLDDDYYPDFTSDNIYLSKEEYDCNNFHDRHYYTSDNTAEMSRERRRYERIDGKKLRNSNDILNDEHKAKYGEKGKLSQCKDNVKNSLEVRFRAPPPLEYPDFKTERINKDRFVSQNDIYYHPDVENYRNGEQNYEKSFYGEVKAPNLDINKNKDHDSEVETIYAHSKVVRYGAKPNIEETSSIFDFTEIKKDDRNLFSNDGETTVILARSLGYPEDY